MPVSADRQRNYPGGSLSSREWKALRAAILTRAGNRCEGSPAYPACRAANHEPHPVTGSRVVLTIAHLNHDPADSNPANLRALCQRCHNTHDAAVRAGRAARPDPTDPRDALDVLAEAHAGGGLAPLGELGRRA